MKLKLLKFNHWFNCTIGWFFVNGRKTDQYIETLNEQKLQIEKLEDEII